MMGIEAQGSETRELQSIALSGTSRDPSSPLGRASVFAVPERFQMFLCAVSPDDVAVRKGCQLRRFAHAMRSRGRAVAPEVSINASSYSCWTGPCRDTSISTYRPDIPVGQLRQR